MGGDERKQSDIKGDDNTAAQIGNMDNSTVAMGRQVSIERGDSVQAAILEEVLKVKDISSDIKMEIHKLRDKLDDVARSVKNNRRAIILAIIWLIGVSAGLAVLAIQWAAHLG